MSLTINSRLCIAPIGRPPVIRVGQYDSNFEIEFEMYTIEPITWDLETGTTAMIRGTKTDKRGYSADCGIDIPNKKVTVYGDVQMTAAAGPCVYEIVLKKNDKEISSINFTLQVERAALDADTIPSESKIKEIQDIGQKADEIIEAYENLQFDSTPTAGSTKAVTSGGIKTYVDNVDKKVVTLQTNIDEIDEQTENINNVGHARCFVNTSGVIVNEDYVGETFVGTPSLLPVVGGSTYACKMFNYTCDSAVTIHVATYNSNKVFITRTNMSYQDFKTFSLANDVAYICVHFNSTSPIVLQDGFQIQIEKGATIDRKIYPLTAVDTKARNDIGSVKDYLGGSVITGWKENCCIYISASPTPLNAVVNNENYRCVVVEVKEGDVVYYSGSDYQDADSGTIARPYGLYNANKELVSYADHGIYKNYEITIPSGVKYVVLNQAYYVGKFDCYINKLPSVIETNTEDYSVINRVFHIVGGYTDQSLQYDSGKSPWYWKEEYGNSHGLTCSDWGMLAFFGIDANHTTWNGLRNLRGFGFDAYEDLYRLKSDNYVWSEGLSKYCDDCGYTYTPTPDMSNCKPGDILFYNLNPDNDSDQMIYPPAPVGTTDSTDFPTIPRYRGVDHCAVFVDKVSDDYYSVLEVAGSTQTNVGYVTFHYIPIASRTIVNGIRPITYTDVKARCLLAEKSTKITKEYEKNYSLDRAVKKDDWITITVKATTIDPSYIGVQAKYLGESSYTTVATESHFGYGVNRIDDTVRFTFAPTKGFKDFKIVSFGTQGSGVRGFYVEEVKLYSGYAR